MRAAWVIVLVAACTGPQGEDGEMGAMGTAGTNGTNGVDGVDGTNGTTGPQGPGAVRIRYINTTPATSIQTPTTVATVGTLTYGANCTIDGSGNVTARLYLSNSGNAVGVPGRVSWQFDDTGSYGTGTMLFLSLTGNDNLIDTAASTADHFIRAVNGPIMLEGGANTPLQILTYEVLASSLTGNTRCFFLGSVIPAT